MVWQTSWGFSTRSIGTMIMVHSDNMGLVLPPFVAHTQFVIIPIIDKNVDEAEMNGKAHELAAQLKKAGLRVFVDDSNKNPGYKYSHWELKGTPVRLELGKKDIAKEEVKVCIRLNGEKF